MFPDMSATAAQPPLIPAGRHPIETQRYVLPTPAIVALHDAVDQWTANRVPGAVIVGRPRLGKTRAIFYVTQWLAQAASPLPVVHWRCYEHKSPAEGVFFEDLLRASGHALVRSGTPSAKRDRLVQWLWEKAHRAGDNRLLLFADDAQRLAGQHYQWLMDIYNDLDAEGVSLITLLVGQQELKHQRSAFLTAGQRQIVGRFMTHIHQFYGVRTEDDLTECLESYDTATEFPVGSGWSFPQYFCPVRFAAGWRLKEEAGTLWEVFARLRRAHAIPSDLDIPMQYVTWTVEYLLKQERSLEPMATWNEGLMEAAIRHSGYLDAEALWTSPPTDARDK